MAQGHVFYVLGSGNGHRIAKLLQYIGMSWPSGKGIKLDAVSSTWLAIANSNPTPYSRMHLHAGGTLVV